jgi:drug/metabolite transporter (DMT)-like permease
MNRKVVLNDLKHMDTTTMLLVVFSAVIAGFFANYLYFNVIKNHASHLVSALVFSSPFFTLLFSYFLLKEDISLTSLIGVMFIVFGVILLAFKAKPKTVAKMKNAAIIRTGGGSS